MKTTSTNEHELIDLGAALSAYEEIIAPHSRASHMAQWLVKVRAAWNEITDARIDKRALSTLSTETLNVAYRALESYLGMVHSLAGGTYGSGDDLRRWLWRVQILFTLVRNEISDRTERKPSAEVAS